MLIETCSWNLLFVIPLNHQYFFNKLYQSLSCIKQDEHTEKEQGLFHVSVKGKTTHKA